MRSHFNSRLAGLAAGLIAFGTAVAAWAVPISPDTWYEFGFFGSDGVEAFGGMWTAPVAGTTQVEGSKWTFTGVARIALTDNFSEGDSFSLFDNGVLVGSTPRVKSAKVKDTPAVHPDLALLDPKYSHGIFVLGPGEHSLSIRVDSSPFGAGAGFFRLTQLPVPDGGSHLFLLGLGALALFRRFTSVSA